ncbi:TPA: copper-binding protein [Citrobacter freundii]
MRITSVFLSLTLIFLSATVFTANAEQQPTNNNSMSGMSMSDLSASSDTAKNTLYSGTGIIKSWSDATVSISHHPIPALNWPAMTMSFEHSRYQGKPFAVGQQVDFTFHQTDSGYAIISIIAK